MERYCATIGQKAGLAETIKLFFSPSLRAQWSICVLVRFPGLNRPFLLSSQARLINSFLRFSAVIANTTLCKDTARKLKMSWYGCAHSASFVKSNEFYSIFASLEREIHKKSSRNGKRPMQTLPSNRCLATLKRPVPKEWMKTWPEIREFRTYIE